MIFHSVNIDFMNEFLSNKRFDCKYDTKSTIQIQYGRKIIFH